MPYTFNNRRRESTGQSWKTYQTRLQHGDRSRQRVKTAIRLFLTVAAISIGAYGLFISISGFALHRSSSPALTDISRKAGIQKEVDAPNPVEDKKLARELLKQEMLVNLREERFSLEVDGKHMWVDTSIDASLQRYMLKKMDRVNSRFIGIVAAEPSTGRIILLSGFNKQDPSVDPCLDNQYPAASIFKIITAAAAIEQCGLTSGSKLRFNGSAHTLYKRQLKDTNNKYTNHITFRDSFARSINPVFGKIGTRYLKKSQLEQYAEGFGFNRKIDFEIELPPSHISISNEPYQWAEIASGFNRKTTISPLHGVLLATAIVNEGRLIEPTIIDMIRDESGKTIYSGTSRTLNRAVSSATSQVLHELMEATIRSGTARKTFRGYKKDRVLSRLYIGGKTGSIFNRKHDLRFDWFVGFAEEKNGGKKLAVSIVVAHEEYIGIRAGQYARMAIEKYFNDYFSENDEQAHSNQAG